MREQHLGLLTCPACHDALQLFAVNERLNDRVIEGQLVCRGCGATFAIRGGVPRFVPRENYASGFGLEWMRHARTQYDSYSGIPASERRFYGQTQWPRSLHGELILEVGSGSGRFTEQAANTGATVVSLDYSYAVEANYAANGGRPNVLIVQADVFAMPFRAGTFDRVFCFGMLQHTPDPAAAFAALPRMLRNGGALCADIYKATLIRAFLHTKYYVRPFTRRMDPERLYERVCHWVNFMWPVASLIRRLPKGYAVNWRLLVADYSPLGLQGDLLKEWSYLDTFDMLAPRYDRPVRIGTFQRWARRANLRSVSTEYTDHGIVLRATAPAAGAAVESR
jgi:SAM-dependent methyltransferase